MSNSKPQGVKLSTSKLAATINRARGYQLPSLQVARKEFDAALGARVDWETDESPRCPFTADQLDEMWETYYIEDAVQNISVLPVLPAVASAHVTGRVSAGGGSRAVASVAITF